MTPRTEPIERTGAVTHKLRVTMEPGVVREVDDAELLDLARQGLIHSYEHTPEAAVVLEGLSLPVERWKGPKKGEEIVTPPAPLTDPAPGTQPAATSEEG